jgi:hypothetical protein
LTTSETRARTAGSEGLNHTRRFPDVVRHDETSFTVDVATRRRLVGVDCHRYGAGSPNAEFSAPSTPSNCGRTIEPTVDLYRHILTTCAHLSRLVSLRCSRELPTGLTR